MTDRVVLLVSTARVAPGLLSWPAWQELHGGHVCTASADHPQLEALAAAGVAAEVLTAADPVALARAVRARTADGRSAVWLADPGGDQDIARELGELARRGDLLLEVVYGSYDLPGARLLDVVATMDRLRSPDGCPWDAEQTHASLAHYLIEEAYEAVEAIESGDPRALREELGDVLLQVAFHARLAEELPSPQRWSIDDVAGDLVAKLVRRHPHVFAGRSVDGVPEVLANWETIKEAEKGRSSVTEGVPLGQPALALAAKLQSRAGRLGLPVALVGGAAETLPQSVAAAATSAAAAGSVTAVGELLFAAAALAVAQGVEPEAALRGTARRFRDRLATVERAARADGLDPAQLQPLDWHERWAASAEDTEAGDDLDADGAAADAGLGDESHHEP